MKAVILTGGKQYIVKVGDQIFVEKLDAEENTDVVFDKVLMIDDKVGTPYIKGAKVTAKVLKQGKSKKITVYKYRPKKKYRRCQGHRQPYTKLTITNIEK